MQIISSSMFRIVLVFISIYGVQTYAKVGVSSQDMPTTYDGNTSVMRTEIEPTIEILETITKSDENSLAMLSLPEGGQLMQCPSSRTTYLKLPGSASRMNIVAESPPYNLSSIEDVTIKYANHSTLENIFPTFAVLFANMSTNANETNFRLHELVLLDLVSGWDENDDSAFYRVEILNVTQTVGDGPTTTIRPMDMFSSGRSANFPSGTLMMDLIDHTDKNVKAERVQYTLARMSETGELAYNAERFAKQSVGGDFVGAQGVMTLWLLGPFSIPLYPAFITCCAASSLIWYLIQPFVFCCII